MRSTVQGPAEGALFSSAWLYVLSCFQYRQGDSVREQPSSMAVRLGDDYMKGIADKVKTLLLRISEVVGISEPQQGRAPECTSRARGGDSQGIPEQPLLLSGRQCRPHEPTQLVHRSTVHHALYQLDNQQNRTQPVF